MTGRRDGVTEGARRWAENGLGGPASSGSGNWGSALSPGRPLSLLPPEPPPSTCSEALCRTFLLFTRFPYRGNKQQLSRYLHAFVAGFFRWPQPCQTTKTAPLAGMFACADSAESDTDTRCEAIFWADPPDVMLFGQALRIRRVYWSVAPGCLRNESHSLKLKMIWRVMAVCTCHHFR